MAEEKESQKQNENKNINISNVLQNLNDEIISLFGLYSAVSPYDSLANSLKQSFNQILDYVDNLRDFASKQNFTNMPSLIKNMWNFYELNIKKIVSIHGDRLKILNFNKDKEYKKLFNNIIDKYSKINELSKQILKYKF